MRRLMPLIESMKYSPTATTSEQLLLATVRLTTSITRYSENKLLVFVLYLYRLNKKFSQLTSFMDGARQI